MAIHMSTQGDTIILKQAFNILPSRVSSGYVLQQMFYIAAQTQLCLPMFLNSQQNMQSIKGWHHVNQNKYNIIANK